jgi:DNA-3-methyladenine glycosylase I
MAGHTNPSRCFGDGDPLYERYHDYEWGRPVTDERGLFERICLEAFQSGLSWRIVLGKRAGMRAAFAGFDPAAVAAFDEEDVMRLLGDASVIRNRSKIEATIANARATIALRKGAGLVHLMWSQAPDLSSAPDGFDELPSATLASARLARSLKSWGFRFVGPTTVYATMQAVGLVNDHLAGCPVRDEVEAAQKEARRALGL